MHQQRGFTLVELSIVLVILGLLIGGVLTGQTLIRAAELRSVSTQHQRYMTAVQTFRDKYFALPGDMTNAQAYWGIANATPATCATTASTGTATCNGDGNGRIWSSAGADERYRFWQHLANAGLIEGSYNGINADTSVVNGASTRDNAPAGRLSSSLWHIFAYIADPLTGNPNFFDGAYGNQFIFGGITAGSPPANGILKPEELYNIDMKTDDGMPAQGKIVAVSPAGFSTCTTASTSSTTNAAYLLTSTALACTISFRQQF